MHRRTLFTLTGSALGIALLNACTVGSNATTTGFNLAVAASLKDVMQALDAAFSQQHPRPAATLQAAGSGALAQQIIDGARFDLFASADRIAMAKSLMPRLSRTLMSSHLPPPI
jgi:molybdate transport system substrate-binding protein